MIHVYSYRTSRSKYPLLAGITITSSRKHRRTREDEREKERARSEAGDKVEIKALLWLDRDWNGIEVAWRLFGEHGIRAGKGEGRGGGC